MPYVKSISVRSNVKKCLMYILDPNKTQGLLYTASLNCMTDPDDAYLNMKAVYEHYSGKSFNEPIPENGKGSVKALHYIQSFDPKDTLTPELAHRIAKAFARKTFGDDCQIVIATHLDKSHIHSHLLLNTYSMEGKRFYGNQATLKHIKEYSDRVCLAFGIQPYDKRKGNGKTVAYNEWENRKRGTSWKQKIQLEIDSLIGSVKNLDELLYELELKGYEVKKGKYISLKAPGQGRFIRTKTLGEEYTADSLASRILWNDVGNNAALTDEPSPLCESYQVIIDHVTQLAVENKKVQRRCEMTVPYSPQNDLDVHRLSALLTIINREHIHSIGEVEGKIESLKSEYEQIRQELNELTVQQEKLSSLVKQAEIYMKLSSKQELSAFEQLQLTVSRQSAESNGIISHSDLDRLKNVLANTDKKTTALKENFKRCQQQYDIYSDIAKTYYEISKGDYISKLVEEERKHKQVNKTTNR